MQLATDRPNPMNASLLARPARACVLTSERGGFDWKTLTVAAIAAGARIWGSRANAILPVPTTPHHEKIFWALASMLDPDLYVHHQPSWADLAELVPDAYAKRLGATKRELRRIKADESLAAEEMERPVEPVDLPEAFGRQLVARTAPLHNDGAAHVHAIRVKRTGDPSTQRRGSPAPAP